MAKPTPITEPGDYLADWATGGGADKARPADVDFAEGFTTGQTTNFNSDLNYALNALADWSRFNVELNAADTACMSLVYRHDDDRTFTQYAAAGKDVELAYIRWDDLANKWLCVFADERVSGLNTSRVWWAILDDISTWPAAGSTGDNVFNRFSAENHWGQRVTPMWSDGTIVAWGVDGGTNASAFVTMDLDGTSLSINTNAYNSITRPYDLFWDQDSSRWFVLGQDESGNGFIESSADDGATWTTELDTTADSNDLISFATDQGGQGLAICSDGDAYYIKAGLTGAWTLDTAKYAGGALGTTVRLFEHRIIDTPVVNSDYLFLINNGSNVYLTGSDSIAAQETDLGNRISIPSEDFLLVTNSLGEFQNISSVISPGAYIQENIGYAMKHDWPQTLWSSNGADYRAGGGKMAFIYEDENSGLVKRLAYGTYGPRLKT